MNELDVIERALNAVRHEDGSLRDVAQIALRDVRDTLHRCGVTLSELSHLEEPDGHDFVLADNWRDAIGQRLEEIEVLTRDEPTKEPAR